MVTIAPSATSSKYFFLSFELLLLLLLLFFVEIINNFVEAKSISQERKGKLLDSCARAPPSGDQDRQKIYFDLFLVAAAHAVSCLCVSASSLLLRRGPARPPRTQPHRSSLPQRRIGFRRPPRPRRDEQDCSCKRTPSIPLPSAN